MMQQLSLFETPTVAAATDAPSVGQQRRVTPRPTDEAPERQWPYWPNNAKIGRAPFPDGTLVDGPGGRGRASCRLNTRYTADGPRSGVLDWKAMVTYENGRTRHHWPEKLRAV